MNLAAALWNGLRTVALRAPRNDETNAGPGLFFALVLVYLGVSIAIAMVEIERPWELVEFGVTTVLTDALLTLAAAWALTRIMRRDDIVWATAAILLAATIATSAIIHWPLQYAASALIERQYFVPALLVDMISRWWWMLVLVVVANWLSPHHLGRVLLAAIVGYAISAAAWWWLPSIPVLMTSSELSADEIAGDEDSSSIDDLATREPEFDAEEVMYSQPDLMDEAIANIRPQTPGKIDLYVVAFAGDAQEDVFRNEVEYAEDLFSQRFGANARVLVLENNAKSVATRPLATLTNLTWALDGIAKIMDPAEDVLLVYLTTHGSEDHELLVDLDPLPLDQISPENLADALATNPGIRWKVLVVNACYSGGFIEALHD
ncbi:MAG: C13 family peptidase, partial [Rhodanobacteraceae bacterium]